LTFAFEFCRIYSHILHSFEDENMKKRMNELTRKILTILLALIIVFGVLSPVIPVAAAVPETISSLTTTPPATEQGDDEVDRIVIIENEDVPLASALNETNGSWSIWLLLPIVLIASLVGLYGVRLLVMKKNKEEEN